MRDLFQRHAVLVSTLCIAVITLTLIWKLVVQDPSGEYNGDSLSDQSWYYDVSTGRYFRDRLDQTPPFKGRDGGEAVRVVFFGCGGCGEGERFPGYYLKYTTELADKARHDPAVRDSLAGESVAGRLFSLDGRNWIRADNAEQAGVFEHHRHRCDGKGPFKMCR